MGCSRTNCLITLRSRFNEASKAYAEMHSMLDESGSLAKEVSVAMAAGFGSLPLTMNLLRDSAFCPSSNIKWRSTVFLVCLADTCIVYPPICDNVLQQWMDGWMDGAASLHPKQELLAGILLQESYCCLD